MQSETRGLPLDVSSSLTTVASAKQGPPRPLSSRHVSRTNLAAPHCSLRPLQYARTLRVYLLSAECSSFFPLHHSCLLSTTMLRAAVLLSLLSASSLVDALPTTVIGAIPNVTNADGTVNRGLFRRNLEQTFAKYDFKPVASSAVHKKRCTTGCDSSASSVHLNLITEQPAAGLVGLHVFFAEVCRLTSISSTVHGRRQDRHPCVLSS